MANHDIIVIGASMGGVEALTRLAGQLPAGLPAALFIVQHLSPDAPSMLPEILNRAGPLPAKAAEDGETIQHGRIYVAPPNRHLLVKHSHVRLSNGPHENRSRPAGRAGRKSGASFLGGAARPGGARQGTGFPGVL